MSTKKLNEALGIDNLESMLEDMNIDEDVQQLKDIDSQMEQNVEKIDTQMSNFQEGGIKKVDITDISTSLNEIKDLINVSKDTIRHVYEQITSVELVDAEAV